MVTKFGGYVQRSIASVIWNVDITFSSAYKNLDNIQITKLEAV